MNAWLWLLVPLAPLLAAALLPWLRERLLPLLPLTCLPGLLAALQPAPALELPWLWEGVRWGGDDLLTRAWLGFSAVLWAAAPGRRLAAWQAMRSGCASGCSGSWRWPATCC